MIRRFLNAAVAVVALTSTVAVAAQTGPSPKPQGAEVTFVSGIQKDLNARFPNPAAAEKAGYFRYTNEDKTGSISYANLQWQSSDTAHPSQLWYSASGKLLGADYSVLKSNTPNQPSLWGVNPKRWETFNAHVHYVLDDNGKEKYGGTSVAKFTAAGGDVNNPQGDTLVKMGIVKDAAAVKHVFLFPAIWDLEVWATPNPNGAFAEMNPLVKPSANASTMDD